MHTQIHDLSGFLRVFHIGGVPIPVYFVITSLSFVVGLLYLVRRGELRGFSRNRILDLSLVIMGSGFFGSRLFHVLFEEPRYYAANPLLVFDIWSGGFVWYGGALLAGALAVLFLRWKKEPLGEWLDLFAPVAALGYGIGRLACFATGCCFGEILRLPRFLGGLVWRHPTQLYAILIELSTLALLLWIEHLRVGRKEPHWLRQPGQIFFVWLIAHGCGRVIMETFRGDPRGPQPLGISIATWISLLLICLASALAVRNTKPRNMKADR